MKRSELQEFKILYRHPPRSRNTYHEVEWRRNWTNCRETYDNAARREYHLLLANARQANHLITLKYFRNFTNLQIIALWSLLKPLLIQHGITGFAVIEITTRRHVEPDGTYWDYPICQCHYHILVESDLSERRLRYIFNQSCLDVGLDKDAFEVQYEAIPDRETFERKCRYILKHIEYKHQAILFRPKTGINKICAIGDWFINPDGSKMNKDKKWDEIVDSWYPERIAARQPQPFSVSFQFSLSIPLLRILPLLQYHCQDDAK